VVELGGIGPGPFAGMLLADHGAEVIRVDRPSGGYGPDAVMMRSRKRIELDLKSPADLETLRALLASADALIDPFRPGTLERLGLGPDQMLAANPRLVYARMTGWGQTGPLANTAGHDINYIALSGALHSIGPADRPLPPLALIGDLGGGGMFLAFSICSALLHAQRTGEGQVIDCAMSEGAGLLMTAFYELRERGQWTDEREANLLDGGAPFYGTYRTADDKFIAVGPLEPQFYEALLERLGLKGDPAFSQREDKSTWSAARAQLEIIFGGLTRDQWCELFEGTDACFAPVLTMGEAPQHPQAVARKSFVSVAGVVQPAPAPRFSRTPLDPPSAAQHIAPGAVLNRGEAEPC